MFIFVSAIAKVHWADALYRAGDVIGNSDVIYQNSPPPPKIPEQKKKPQKKQATIKKTTTKIRKRKTHHKFTILNSSSAIMKVQKCFIKMFTVYFKTAFHNI